MGSASNKAFIEAKDLRKTYHVGKIEVEALRGISFSVQKGEFVSVVGPSGSGKSTLFYLLGGLTRADGGSVVLDGEDLATLSDAERTRMRKRKIGFVSRNSICCRLWTHAPTSPSPRKFRAMAQPIPRTSIASPTCLA